MFGFGKRPENESAESRVNEAAVDAAPQGLFGRLKAGLSRTRESLARGLGNLLLGKKAIDQTLLDALETQLLSADVGVRATTSILADLAERTKRRELGDSDALYAALSSSYAVCSSPANVRCRYPPISASPSSF